MIKVKQFNLGPIMTNAFLVWDESKEAYLFDCGGENIAGIIKTVNEENLNLKYMVLTHGHGDHIIGLNKFMEAFPDAEVYIGLEEQEFLTDSKLSLSRNISGEDFKYTGKYKTLVEGDKVGLFTTIDTPGHTIGSKSFYYPNENILMSGDTMFKNSYGRYDLPTGDISMLFDSLRKLCTLPDETVVYSGHTESTTIQNEKRFLYSQGII